MLNSVLRLRNSANYGHFCALLGFVAQSALDTRCGMWHCASVPISAPFDLTKCRRFFREPTTPRQRQYEALRAYFIDEVPSAEAARRFGYTPGAFRVLCHAFRRGELPELFATARPGPRGQPRKSRAHEQIVALRKRNYSVYDISEALKQQGTSLSPTAVREVLAEEGFAPLPRRLDEERPAGVGPTTEAVADVREFHLAPREFITRLGGLFLFVPDLVRVNADDLAVGAKLPGSRMIPASHALRASLALKLWSIERKSHVMALVADEGLALFSGRKVEPKKSFLSEYTSHYQSKRSRRDPSILTFLAQDADAHVFCYSNANIRKGEEADEVFRFVEFWKRHHGKPPQELVFDSTLTTYEGLDRLDAAGIHFLTLRRRSPSLIAEMALLPASAWRTVPLEVSSRKHRTPRVFEQKVRLRTRTYRQFFIKDLGHDEPTILIANDANATPKQLITRYAGRRLIENALCDAVRFFHIDALSSSVALKADFDMALLVLASGLYRIMARRMRGYDEAQARQIFRDLIDMSADVAITPAEIRVRFHRRAHLPVVLASGLFDKPVPVPWWEGRSLRLVE